MLQPQELETRESMPGKMKQYNITGQLLLKRACLLQKDKIDTFSLAFSNNLREFFCLNKKIDDKNVT